MAREKLFSVTLDDCRVDTFASGGPGGQHQNRTYSGVRVTHPPSGAVGTARDERSQHTNKRLAFRRMAESQAFRAWVKLEAARLRTGKTVEQLVEEQIQPHLLKVEAKDEHGRWFTIC